MSTQVTIATAEAIFSAVQNAALIRAWVPLATPGMFAVEMVVFSRYCTAPAVVGVCSAKFTSLSTRTSLYPSNPLFRTLALTELAECLRHIPNALHNPGTPFLFKGEGSLQEEVTRDNILPFLILEQALGQITVARSSDEALRLRTIEALRQATHEVSYTLGKIVAQS